MTAADAVLAERYGPPVGPPPPPPPVTAAQAELNRRVLTGPALAESWVVVGHWPPWSPQRRRARVLPARTVRPAATHAFVSCGTVTGLVQHELRGELPCRRCRGVQP